VLQPAPSEVTHSYKHQPKSSFKVAPNLPWCHICLRTKQRLRKGETVPDRALLIGSLVIPVGLLTLG
jgi:hypothetical protein